MLDLSEDAFRAWCLANKDKAYRCSDLRWTTEKPLARWLQAQTEFPLVEVSNSHVYGRNIFPTTRLPLWASQFNELSKVIKSGYSGKDCLGWLDLPQMKRIVA